MPSESALRPHAISVSAAFELLTTTLRNPSRVDACARRMSVAADRIDQALEARTLLSEKIKFAKSRPDFLRAGIKFLTLNQTKKDWESMIDHLAQCRCSTLQSRRILHYPNRLRPDERLDVQDRIPIFDVVSTVSKCIIFALSNLTQDKFHSGTTSSGKKIWPQSPEDLLPYGPNATLAGFVLWLNDPPEGVVIFKLAVRLALFYSPFSEKVFDAELVAGKAVLHLAVATVFFRKGDPSPRARLCRFTQPVLAVLQFFEDLTICDISAFFHVFIGGHQWVKKVFEPVRDILRTMPEEWNKTLRILGYIIGASQASFDEEGIISINVGIAADVRIIQDYPNDEGVEYLSRIIVEARSMGCWNVTCTSALGRGQLRVCRKCDLLRFCSEECQKLAWKFDGCPHKEVCGDIHSFKESLGNDWSVLWSPDYTHDQFRVICRANKVGTGVVDNIVGQLWAVKKYRAAFLQDPNLLTDPTTRRKMVMTLTMDDGEKVQIS